MNGPSFNRQESIQRSVDSLERIYAVVVALAITIAVQKVLFDANDNLIPFFDQTGDNFVFFKSLWPRIPALVAFMFVIVPFYHGMGRHLDQIYIEREVPVSKEGFLVADFVAFFLESCFLVAAASLVTNGDFSFLVLMALLLLDLCWALVAHGIHYGTIQPGTLRWSIINGVAVVALWTCYSTQIFSGEARLWTMSLVLVVRAVVDYSFCWRFYFPNQNA